MSAAAGSPPSWAQLERLARPETALPFQVGEQVRHRFFGDGEVTAVEGSRVTVRFPRAGMTKVHPSFLRKAAPVPGASPSAA